jgi:hypothetical protein
MPMLPNWQPCPHCKVLFTPRPDGTPRSHCPACRQPLPTTALPTTPPTSASLPRQAARQLPYELLFALLAVWGITLLYGCVAWFGIPSPSSLLGHALGSAGFLLMLSTETLYTLRKRVRRITLGRTGTWLQVHVFTGIVGPYLVLLHSAGKFHGLAGVLTLLTVVTVGSGFVGRYLYQAVSRCLSGAELAAARRLLALWRTAHIPLSVAVFCLAFIHIGAALYYATFLR